MWDGKVNKAFQRGLDYVDFGPDRVAMQDATAQMALLQFMQAGKDKVAVPSTAHADHLIQAKISADKDLQESLNVNNEVFNFLVLFVINMVLAFWKPRPVLLETELKLNTSLFTFKLSCRSFYLHNFAVSIDRHVL